MLQKITINLSDFKQLAALDDEQHPVKLKCDSLFDGYFCGQQSQPIM
jgi:hypothetical protein